MRASWTGYVSFGLVNVPVKVYKATEDRSVKFNQLHAADGGRIRQQKVCGDCGEILTPGDICRGFEHSKGEYVTFTDSELERGLGGVRGVEIVRFLDPPGFDSAYIEATYYIGPDDRSTSKTRIPPTTATLASYRLLVEAMLAENVDALARVTVRERERMALLRVHEDREILCLDMLRWSDEVRPAEPDHASLLATIQLPPEQLTMARRLVDSLRVDEVRLGEFVDTYRARIEQLVSLKIAGEEIPDPEPEDSAAVVDLMAALSASIQATAEPAAVNQ